jgi:hypothetical protein
LPAVRDVLCGHVPAGRLEVLGLEVAEYLAPVAEDRVVADAGLAERVEHLGPDLLMGGDVFVDPVGLDAQDERPSLGHRYLLGDDEDDEIAWAVDSFDTVELDVRGRRRARDERHRATGASDRVGDPADRLGHAADDL